MNNPDTHEPDLLSKFIDAERIEKAPEEFTRRVMAGIRLEHEKSSSKKGIIAGNIVPVVSAIVIIALIILASVLPGSPGEPIPAVKIIKNIRIPEINFDLIRNIKIPEWVPYIFIGIFFLGLFDLGISGLFRRKGSRM